MSMQVVRSNAELRAGTWSGMGADAQVPEVVGRQFFYQGCCQPLTHHQQKSDHDVMVALIVVELRVAIQDKEDDVDQLFLEPFSLLIWHAWGEEVHLHWQRSLMTE